MLNMNMLTFTFWVLKTLHLHPEQKFNLFYFLMRGLWFISLFIYAITVTINWFHSNNLSAGNIQINTDLILSTLEVSAKRVFLSKYGFDMNKTSAIFVIILFLRDKLYFNLLFKLINTNVKVLMLSYDHPLNFVLMKSTA